MSRILAIVLSVLFAAGIRADTESCARPSIGLALGSGGAGGLAHIAMLQVFEDLELRPDAIAGTSIGAIIGALYAAGLDSGQIRELFREFGGSALDPLSGLLGDGDAPSLRDMIEIDLDRASLIDSARFIEFIAERFEARRFAQLSIPLKIVATDYWSGEPVVIDDGDLLRAIGASMAVPGLFAPVPDGDRLLIDGGASNPLPLDLVSDLDLVVAIDVTGSRSAERDGRPGISDLLFSTFEIMQQSILREELARHPPHVYIKPTLSGIRLLHFDRLDEILEQARPAAEELRRLLTERISAACD